MNKTFASNPSSSYLRKDLSDSLSTIKPTKHRGHLFVINYVSNADGQNRADIFIDAVWAKSTFSSGRAVEIARELIDEAGL